MAAVVAAAAKKGKKGEATPDVPRFGRVKANLKMGILGLPNVGKSSLFNLLTDQAAAAENYPFCTIDPNESRCPVPDQRFNWLCDLWQPASKIPAYLLITDIAGLIKGASEGAGLGNAFLSHIQAVDGLYHVVRAFDNPEVIHVEDTVDPIRDMETIMYELCRKDSAYVESVRAKKEQDVKRDPKNKLPPVFYTVMDKVKEMLENNTPLRSGKWSIEEVAKLNELVPQAITLKPIVYLVNLDAKSFKRKGNKWLVPINEWVQGHGGGIIIPFSVEWEQGLWAVRDDPAATEKYLAESDGAKSVLPRIVKVGYNALQLQYFFTAGEDEVRCWTVCAGACAPEAAGTIHSDFERGFIKAEVCSFEDFKTLCNGQKSYVSIMVTFCAEFSCCECSTLIPFLCSFHSICLKYRLISKPPASIVRKAATTSCRMATSYTSCLT
jgi:obg-like ATPase 1